MGTYKYATADKAENGLTDRFIRMLAESVLSVAASANMIVIKPLPGLASAAASAIDAMNMSVVLGTLAGDDTVFVVMRDSNSAAAFCGEIRSLLN